MTDKRYSNTIVIMLSRNIRFAFLISLAALFLVAFTSLVLASHSWGNYHWARSSNPFTLNLGDNVSSTWDSYLATTSSDWTVSSVLDTVVVASN